MFGHTPGVTLARFARESNERTESLRAELMGEEPQSKIGLAAGRGCYLYLLSETLREFSATFPNRVRLMTRNRDDTLSAVRCGEAHLGVTVLTEKPPHLDAKLLLKLTPRLIVSTNHPLAGRSRVSLKVLEGLPLVCPEPPSQLALIFTHKSCF